MKKDLVELVVIMAVVSFFALLVTFVVMGMVAWMGVA